MKRIVIPGELITTENKKLLSGVYKDKEGIKSMYLGVVYDSDFGVKVVALKGKYEPKIGDLIIGKVAVAENFYYLLDINSYKYVNLSKRDIRAYLDKNNLVLLRITDVNEIKDISVEFVNKLQNGFLLQVDSKKIPRVIGKAKSMLNIIEKYTNTKLVVGNNGYIFVIGDNVEKVKKVLEKIERYSYVDSLTDKIENYLKKGE